MSKIIYYQKHNNNTYNSFCLVFTVNNIRTAAPNTYNKKKYAFFPQNPRQKFKRSDVIALKTIHI